MEEQQNRLFVGNLAWGMNDEGLRNLFAGVEGIEVTDAKVIIDKFKNRSKGFGFVEVSTPEMAQTAIQQLNGKEIEGRAITVNLARPQAERPHGGDRGPAA